MVSELSKPFQTRPKHAQNTVSVRHKDGVNMVSMFGSCSGHTPAMCWPWAELSLTIVCPCFPCLAMCFTSVCPCFAHGLTTHWPHVGQSLTMRWPSSVPLRPMEAPCQNMVHMLSNRCQHMPKTSSEHGPPMVQALFITWLVLLRQCSDHVLTMLSPCCDHVLHAA